MARQIGLWPSWTRWSAGTSRWPYDSRRAAAAGEGAQPHDQTGWRLLDRMSRASAPLGERAVGRWTVRMAAP
eukprot:10879859-Alexandrium_andersonii.AAC.1